MIRIGVVGGIGSGKSYIAKLFGYPVFNADIEVAKLYRKNRKCYKQLKKTLPNYIKSFPIKKNKLSEAIIDRQNNLKKIIKIIHPQIRKRLNIFIKKNRHKKFIVLDIPLLMEDKINKKNDIIVFIDSKKKEVNKRLKKRHNFNLEVVKKLKKLQLSVEIKKKKANYIIKNNFKNNYVKKNVKLLVNKILSNA